MHRNTNASLQNMIIPRDYYLNQLISAQKTDLIKIITGIRRCGKSFLLFKLFHAYLNENGIDNSHIIEVALDDRMNKSLRDPDNLLKHIYDRVSDNQPYYVLLDEIQLVEDFVGVLNSLLHASNLQVYVTGSNSRFLSKDVITEFRGRGQEIHLYPLSFSEYYNAVGGDKSDRWREYYTFGGLPQVLSIDEYNQKVDYLENLASTVFLRDVVERNSIKGAEELTELLKILASSIGSPCNPSKLSSTFKSVKNVSISPNTIGNFLSYFEDAFLVERSIRYNIKGKKYINTLAKYYFTDIGLRNALLDFRQIEETHLMENIIYNELRMRGFSVDVGCVESTIRTEDGAQKRVQYKVDFVANKGSQRYYIQSALSMPDEAKIQQETKSFRIIGDGFKKVIVVGSNIMPHRNIDGYLLIGIYDFLLNPDTLITG